MKLIRIERATKWENAKRKMSGRLRCWESVTRGKGQEDNKWGRGGGGGVKRERDRERERERETDRQTDRLYKI